MHRVHQLHFARSTSHADRDTLTFLAAESLASYYADSARIEEALKIYENYVRKPKTDKVKSSPNSNADGSMSVEPYMQCRGLLMKVFVEVMLQFEASTACVKSFGAYAARKDYRQQRKGFEIIGKIYAKQKNYDAAVQSWENALAFCPKILLTNEIHILIVKAYEAMKTLSPWLCITPVLLSCTNRLVQVKISFVST